MPKVCRKPSKNNAFSSDTSIALSILSTTYPLLLQSLAHPVSQEQDLPTNVLTTAILRILLDLPDSVRDGSEKSKIAQALTTRYSKLNKSVPQAIRSAMALPDLFDSPSDLAQEFMRQGPAVTASIDSVKDLLRRYGRVNINDEQVSNAIMFMVMNSYADAESYKLNICIDAIRNQCSNIINWNNVVRGFDREFFVVDKTQFLSLYHALASVAREDATFDIELLWSSGKANAAAQLASAISFASLTPEELDATTIMNLQASFDAQDAADGSEDIQALAEQARHDTMISLKAVEAIVDALWGSNTNLSPQDMQNARVVITDKMALFVCSAAGIASASWSESLRQFLERTVYQCLIKAQQHHSFILHILWKQDKHWLHNRLVQFHSDDPIKLPLLLEHAQEHGWLRELCTTVTGFGIDLAAMAHKKGYIDIQEWADDKLKQGPVEFTTALTKFLLIKTQDEMRTARGEQLAPRTVSLAMKTVHAILEILEEYTRDGKEELNSLERHCMQAFPRLCNYGEGFDLVIEENGVESNALPNIADAAMQEQYKKMYSGELDVKTVIEKLRDCKTSEDPEKQDLFACMIHGLFDEFVCFNEYPLGPLAKTAVLFGGIINYRLINNIALNVALEMVMESVRDYPPEAPMYKFGLQALLHFLGRLQEWPELCQRLLQVHGLQGKEVYNRAQEVVQNRTTNGTTDDDLQDGSGDDFIDDDSLVAQFRSINVDPLPYGFEFENPEEEVEDKVLFILNNVSSENLSSKIKELVEVLEPKHYQWFANYIVEQRAKSQPNYQELYLNLLDLLNDKTLWAGVLRESYVSIRKIINAEATMKLATERTNLKNLAVWLGSLTIARERPIKHKNIAFKELLLEGWETSRLILVIPFTCEVLGQGTKSVLFKPPNPWVMEIIGLLLELYDLSDLKIQQKFAIEILLGNFGLPRKGEGMERSNDLKTRRRFIDTAVNDALPSDGLDIFNELGMNPMAKMSRPRFTPPPLPDLENLLVLPPIGNASIGVANLRRLVLQAVKKSIEEIIGPVVERSITIATISTKSLVQKDFSQEGDENMVRQAFENMVKSLAGSLASVTSKEPLRMSMNTYIRNAAAELPEQTLPEGSILMCVNDNLDMACRIIQKQAEERALLEIEPAIESEVAIRREHKVKFPNEPYRDANTSHWATYIPEPYKQVAGGLNQAQMDIYQHFAPQTRGANSLTVTSTDSSKQSPDVLQEFSVASVPNLTTPAEQPAHLHQGQQSQPQTRLLPPSIASTRPPSQVNGFMDGATLWEHIQESLAEVIRDCKEANETRMKDLSQDSPILETSMRVITLVRSAPVDADQLALQTVTATCQALFIDGSVSILEAQVLVQIIGSVISGLPDVFSNKLAYQLRLTAEEHIHVVPVTAALLESGFIDYVVVDTMLATAIQQRNVPAQKCLAELLDVLLFVPDSVALRSDFSRSFAALSELISRGGTNEVIESIMIKLKTQDQGEDTTLSNLDLSAKKSYQLEHLYEHWCLTYAHTEGGETTLLAFMIQVGQSAGLASSGEDMIKFLRFCIESAVRDFSIAAQVSRGTGESDAIVGAYLRLDAVAKLMVLVIKSQDEGIKSKAQHLKSMLLMIALILHDQQRKAQDTFNPRSFLRLISSTIYAWHSDLRGTGSEKLDKEMILAIGEILLVLQPTLYPGFVFEWMTLLTQQAFLLGIMKLAGQDGIALFASLMEALLSYSSRLIKSTNLDTLSRMVYRGMLRILLVLHHDFPEFLSDYHFQLCNVLPPGCMQLRNLVLSAYPNTILELPDPFSDGLKVDRLDDIKRAPNVVSDFEKYLQPAALKDALDSALQTPRLGDEQFHRLVELLPTSESFHEDTDLALLHAVVLYIGQKAVSASNGSDTGPAFTMDGPYSTLICQLARVLESIPRYFFLGGIVNQLRYPNSHTWFFSSTLLSLFGTGNEDERNIDIRHQVTRVLLERLVVHRPHPWGLIIVLLELMKNRSHAFWDQPFVKGSSEVREILGRISNLES